MTGDDRPEKPPNRHQKMILTLKTRREFAPGTAMHDPGATDGRRNPETPVAFRIWRRTDRNKRIPRRLS